VLLSLHEHNPCRRDRDFVFEPIPGETCGLGQNNLGEIEMIWGQA
jgi:hypothetical protein